MERLAVFFDEHLPHSIPHYFDVSNPTKETAVDKFLMDFQPTILGHGGDTMDLDCISHWNKKKVRLIEGKRLRDDFNMLNVLLAKHDAIVDKSVQSKFYLRGNHEGWLDDVIDETPQALEGFIELESATELVPRGYEIVGRRLVKDVGNLGIIHGDFRDGYAPVFHARTLAQLYHQNLAYGHFHTEQSHTDISPVTRTKYRAVCVGTMGNVSPRWRKNQSDGWVNSFLVGERECEGQDWNLNLVKVFDHGFTYNGVNYK